MKTWWADVILSWYAEYGRHDLPWQHPCTPYRCWISEIMLQQTQVTTVIPYFERFTGVFPTLPSLATAPLEAVLALWSGLGYYARARNLHKTAQIIMNEYSGVFPANREVLLQLPGIGLSTAHAIIAQSFDRPAAILDGNVKRVLARFQGIDTPLTDAKTLARLWALAETYLPPHSAPAYAQALMDLGATVCTRIQPKCVSCPLQRHCVAAKTDNPAQFPVMASKRRKPTKTEHFLFLVYRNQVGLIQRPPTGIWGGLFCLPTHSRLPALTTSPQGPYRHTFTHFHLDYCVSLINLKKLPTQDLHWYSPEKALQLGLPSPIRGLIEEYQTYGILPKVKARAARAFL